MPFAYFFKSCSSNNSDDDDEQKKKINLAKNDWNQQKTASVQASEVLMYIFVLYFPPSRLHFSEIQYKF